MCMCGAQLMYVYFSACNKDAVETQPSNQQLKASRVSCLLNRTTITIQTKAKQNNKQKSSHQERCKRTLAEAAAISR